MAIEQFSTGWKRVGAGLGLLLIVFLALSTSSSFHPSPATIFVPPKHRQKTMKERPTNHDVEGVKKFVSENREPCQKRDNYVFLKTHKTGGTTAASVFKRYAYFNNLTEAVPAKGPTMNLTELFQPHMIAEFTTKGRALMRGVGFNAITHHARYNRPKMDEVVHNATYVTIIREPAKQFVSAFVYFRFHRMMEEKLRKEGRPKTTNSAEEFMQHPDENLRLFNSNEHVVALHNAQIFDLGFDIEKGHDIAAINDYIDRLDKEFDLVMITEYMDHSLILLRDVMCWTTNDILYKSYKVRRPTKSDRINLETKRKIREWNAADVLLYEHFNRTLWRRIAEYGPSFDQELQQFRQLLASKRDKLGNWAKGGPKNVTQIM